MRATYVALLQGPSLRSGFCCPGPSTLNRPHPPHSQVHHNFAVPKKLDEVVHGLATASRPCRKHGLQAAGDVTFLNATSISSRLGKGREPGVEAQLCELDDKAFGPDFL